MSKSNQISIETKKEIIKIYRESKISQRKLADKYNSSLGCINSIIKNSNSILAINGPINKRKPNLYKTKDIDNLVYQWFEQKRQSNFIITDDILKLKALEFSEEFNIEHFNASSGWLRSFKQRHGIKSFKICGDSDLIDTSVVSNYHTSIQTKIEQYNQKDIFNCDELGLFYKGLHERTLSQMKSNLKCKLSSKVRISILLCCSSTGEKLPPLIIGKFKSPRCFKNINVKSLGLDYKNNTTAWMTSSIFTEWIIEFNKKLILNNRRILLILDNAPVHPSDIQLSNIELLFLPPKTTGMTQPLDAGIIRSFKCKYRKLFNEKLILESMDEDLSSAMNKITLLDSLLLIKKSWESVTTCTIRNCFIKTCILKENIEEMALLDDELIEIDNNFDPFLDEENLPINYFIENAKDVKCDIEVQNEYDEENDNDNNIADKVLYDISYPEALLSLENLEMWFIQNIPNNMEYIDAIKNQLIEAKKKKKSTILDYFPRKRCDFN